MFFLCVPHHLGGVSFKSSSSANNVCFTGTTSSNSNKKVYKQFKPSNVGKLLTSVPIQRTSLVNLAHLRAENLYILLYQFSSASSEFDDHALSLLQLKFPSVVGFHFVCKVV
jgi:hypothetical protein